MNHLAHRPKLARAITLASIPVAAAVPTVSFAAEK
ncbi:MAG: hypothetical protein ACI8Z1_001440, partial [Candidatus Azotimanducaceae bacterium]